MRRNEFKYLECTYCEDGMVYIDTSRQCTIVRNECCGGCGYSIQCSECDGIGEIEVEVEPTYSQNNKTRTRRISSIIHKHHLRKLIKSWKRL